MFSNLHTENGVTNHLIMPSGIQLTNWQYDAVDWVTFRRDGKNETFDMKRPETYSTLEPLGPVANHYFYFRSFGKHPLREACQQ
jgi:hypothetical protein